MADGPDEIGGSGGMDPGGGAPPARPVELAYATARAVTAPRGYPESELTRAQAWADLGILFAVLLGFIVIVFLTDVREFLADHFPQVGHMLPAFGVGALCLATIAARLRRRGQNAEAIGLGRPRWKWIGVGILAVPICYLAGAISNVLFVVSSGKGFMEFAQERGEFLTGVSEIPTWLVFALSLFVGVYEEIVFRGFILSRLRALTRGTAAPVLLSSLIFGGLHFTQGPMGMCQTTVVGVIFGALAVRTRSLWPCMVGHALIDSISLVLAGAMSEEIQKFLHEAATQPGS